MRNIKIFLASSINEFAAERMALKNFVRQMQNVLVDYEIFVRLFICEYADNSMADGRKQDDFSGEIDDSDIFFILTGKRLGEYTLEEYNYALEIQKKNPDLRILACFKVCDELEETATSFSKILSANATRADFNNVIELKTAFAKLMDEILGEEVPFKVEGGCMIVANKKIKL